MAPEVLRGESYGLSADVYSLGVVLWEVLVRQQPFAHLNHYQVRTQTYTRTLCYTWRLLFVLIGVCSVLSVLSDDLH
eukprot:COSAG05_NODE_311_length_11636_cov_11.922250_15_plen_77_part_00